MPAIATVAGFGLVGLLYATGFFEGFMSGLEGHPGLPSCDSAHALSDAKGAIANSPALKSAGITVLTVTEPKTITTSATKMDCAGSVLLSNGTRGNATYSFTTDTSLGQGQYLVRSQLDLESFHPYP